jgi:D-arabinose 1-dehydrogenase-like Zn-dependent alcohol dehydrogenase
MSCSAVLGAASETHSRWRQSRPSQGEARKRYLVRKNGRSQSWYSGTAVDSEDTFQFNRLNNIASMNEIFPLEQAQAAYDRMMSGKARFRVVLKIN